MIFSYNWLQDYIKGKLPRPEKLAELLTMHSFEVEEMRKKEADWVLDIGVTPNRAGDCFSHLGIAREIAAVTGKRLEVRGKRLKEDQNLKAEDFVNVTVKDKNACPRYSARVFTDVKVGPSPKWMQERLRVCGLRPINNIVDITNYVMLETGQPLHAFDGEKITNKKIIVRFAKKGEKLTTLDGERYDLDKDILVIADSKKPIGIAGIKGELSTGVDKATKIVVLEGANFERLAIRKGSQKLKLKTDASWRFEHGIDPNLTETAINRAAGLIQELAGAKIAQGLIDYYPKKVLPKKIRFDLDFVEKLLGIKIPRKKIIRILKSLEFKCNEARPRYIEVEVPTFRLDVSIPEDLVEEVGRIYGYEKIPAIAPSASLIPPERNLEIFWERIAKDILKELGFCEVYNYSFIDEKKAKLLGYKLSELLEIENPISEYYKYLSPSLIPNLLENVKGNFRYFDQIKIFELGKAFGKFKAQSSKLKVLERRALTGLIARKEAGEAFYELKGVIDTLLEKMGISNFWYDSYQPSPETSKISIWRPPNSAEIKVDNQEIGFLGEISPRILEALKIKGEVVLFDLDFEKLQQLASEEQEFRPISSYPAAIRDLAVLVPKTVKVAEVLNKINEVGGDLVRDVDLFDLYEGEEIPEGKKNLAFHLIYQAEDRTLTSREINKIHSSIVKALEEAGWEVRR